MRVFVAVVAARACADLTGRILSLALELDNSEKRWITLFQIWLYWKVSLRTGTLEKFGKIPEFFPAKERHMHD